MNPQSAKALAWTAGILIVIAPAIISTVGSFPLLVLAAICAAIPSGFATKWTRRISIVLLILAIAFAASIYPSFVSEMAAYKRHGKEQAVNTQVTTPTDQTAIKK